MSRSKAISYPFDAVPSDIAPEWHALPFQTRSLGPALWILGGGGEPIPVIADWAPFLCMQLRIGGKERPNIVLALYRLQKLGLLVVADGSVTVLLRACQVAASRQAAVCRESAGSLTAVCAPSAGSLTGVCEESAGSNSSKSLNSDLTKRLKKENKEREKSAGAAAEAFIPARRPLPEPPPGFVDTFQEPEKPTELSLEDQILTTWKRAVGDKLVRTPGTTTQATAGAKEVAAWLRENVREGETPLGAFQAALKLYVADDKESLRTAAWPLKWLTERLPGYLAAKPTAAKSTNPAHQIWQAPDYERDMREANERHAREQAAWLAEHPEHAEAVAVVEAMTPKPRVVVSIVEAKPPKRAAPLNEQQRQERIRLLQEQAEQIRAASAAE